MAGLDSRNTDLVRATARRRRAHKLQIWDALILNAAAEAGCTLLLSEDMSSGFAWRGTVVIDPFHSSLHDRLARILA